MIDGFGEPYHSGYNGTDLEELDDYLNNILFDTFDEVVEAVKEWFEKEKGVSRDRQEYADLASRFIDHKELYDISYDD